MSLKELEELRAEVKNVRFQLAEAQGENNFQECRWKLSQRMLNEACQLIQELEKTNQQLRAEIENLRSHIKFLPEIETD